MIFLSFSWILKYIHASLVLRVPELDSALWHHQSWVEWKDHLPWLMPMTNSASQNTIGLFVKRTWSCSEYCPSGLQSTNLQLIGPQLIHVHGAGLSSVQDFPMLNLVRFLLAHFFRLLKFSWTVTSPSCVWGTHSQFCVISQLLKGSFAPASNSLMKI